MTVLNDLFDYGLKIYQEEEFFKFSLDSLLLAEFVKYRSHDKILDLCTGNAPVPLILGQKDSTLNITGIELQENIYSLGVKSVRENKMQDRITLINGDAKTYEYNEKFDIVTCNPPYFKDKGTSLKNLNETKRIARHEIAITLEDIVAVAKRNLKETGTLYLVHRVDRFLEVINVLQNNKFGIRDIAFVFTKKNKKAEFFLIEASKYKKSDSKIYEICTEDLTTYQRIFEGGR